MGRMNKNIIRTGLETLYFTGGHHLARPFLSGVGTILTFHHVRPPRADGFQPNRSLEITPAFLDQSITRLRADGLDIVSMDEAHRRLTSGDFSRRFVVLTFDDGYRDIAGHAWPILKRHSAPATLYIPSSFPDGDGVLWWVELERAIAVSASIALDMNGGIRRFDTATDAGKDEAFAAIYWWLRSLPDEAEIRRVCRDLAVKAGVDVASICKEFCMGWDDLARLAGNRLITIGAHTESHLMLAKASEAEVRREMKAGAEAIEKRLGVRPKHFAFPVGDSTSAGVREFEAATDLGFDTAVTTRPGVLFPDHRAHLTALPRISVNGNFQRSRYLDVLMSGAPTYVMNRFKRVDAA